MADGVGQFGEVGDHGARLFLGTVLPEGDKIIVLAVQKRADVRSVSGERVVGGDGENDGRFVAEVGFGGEVSATPFASFAIVFPVQGAMTSASKRAFGPMGSTCGMVWRISWEQMASSRSRKEEASPKRESVS